MTRIGWPFAVNFDHCCTDTESLFLGHPLCVGGYLDHNPDSYFDESYRQRCLDILQKLGFQWMFQMDVDETLEKDIRR